MRVKATTLESFRLLQTQDWMTEERFLDQVRGPFEPTPEMLVGRAVHACIEAPERYHRADGAFEAEGVVLPADLVRACLAAVPPGGVHEVRGEKVYRAGGVDVTVSCIADLLHGNMLHEFKTRWRPWDGAAAEGYAASLQWRIYADVFWSARVRYTAFQLDRDGDAIALVSTNSLDLYPYPDMRPELQTWVERFVEYVDARDLRALFPDRRRAA